MKAVEVLIEHGVPEERIIFINLIAAPEGLRNFCGKYPALRVVCRLPLRRCFFFVFTNGR
jgi:uracil phosphoribosyltransferase